MSTYDIIRWFKKETGFKGKVGHGGTLDVFASGVVLLLLDQATKRFADIQKLEKTYLAGVRLGVESTTLDVEGDFSREAINKDLAVSDIKAGLEKFKGEFLQSVPAYSAAKHHGKPLYELARKGIEVDKNKLVTIYSLDIVSFKSPLITLKIGCSSGTYVRQLAYDIFNALGSASFLYFLERQKIGKIDKKMCAEVEDLASNWKKHLFGVADLL